MVLTRGAENSSSLNIDSLLRRASIEKLIAGSKFFFLGAILLIVVIVSHFGLQNVLEASATVLTLEGEVEKQLLSAQKPRANRVSSRDYALIVKKNIFGSLKSRDPEPRNTRTAPKSDVPLSLIGTFISDGQPPYAIIEDQKKRSQEVFNIGDMIFETAKLSAILPDRVEIERNGKIEVLTIDDGPATPTNFQGGVASRGDDEFVIDEATLDKELENLSLLLTQARAVPYFRDGKSIGLRLFAIKSGSLFQKLGLKNGDILKSINGNSLADITQAMKLFEQLKQERSVTLMLERSKQEKQFRYSIQ